MILLVDVGNTRTKWRLLDGYTCLSRDGFFININITSDLLRESFLEDGIIKVILSCVGSDVVSEAFLAFAKSEAIEFHRIVSQRKIKSLTFSYEKIERLGVDRCMAMLGAFEGDGVLVIDAGSAITADYIGSDGHHLGGYILPGFHMSRSALLGKTAKIGVMAKMGVLALGENTDDCVNNGFAIMYRSLITGLIEVAHKMNIKRYVLTGGDAEMLKSFSDEDVGVIENLVLDGMQKYAVEE